MSARHLLVCTLLCALISLRVSAQALLVDVVPGFDGIAPSSGFYPVTVWIQGQRGNAPPSVCEVEVTARSWTRDSRARKLVTLPGGAVSQAVSLTLYVPDEPYEFTARLILRGRVLAVSKPASVQTTSWFPLLVGLGTDSCTLAHLPDRSLGVATIGGQVRLAESVPPPPSLSPFGPPRDDKRVFIGRVRNSLPPELALAYRGVAAVSLDDRAWDTLNERQQNALIRYVRSGGVLVVHGVDINRLQTLMPSGLLPVEPLGLTTVSVSALGSWLPAIRRVSGAVDVVRSRPLGGSRVLLSAGDVPLVVSAPRGFGQVVFLAFDPGQPPFSSDDVAHALWKRLLRLHVNRFVPPVARVDETSPWQGQYDTMTISLSSLSYPLIQAVGSKPVAVAWLVIYLGVYILVLIPLNYLLLRKLDRLQWSWFTLPAIAVLVSAAGYALATQMQTGSHQLRRWTALYTVSGSPQAVVESDWVHYSARTMRYRLRATVDGVIFETSPKDLQAEWGLETPQDEPTDVRGVQIALWSARTFHLSGETTLPGAVTVSASAVHGDTVQLTVCNGTPYTLRNLRMLTPLGVSETLGECPAGGEARVSVRGKDFQPRRFHEIFDEPWKRSWSQDEWREQTQLLWEWNVGSHMAEAYLTSHWYLPPFRWSQVLGRTCALLAEVDGFPAPVEVTPSGGFAQEQVTALAVVFEMPGGKR